MPPATDSRFLDRQALAALERLRFKTRHRIEGAYTGRHASRQKGGSGEFVDFREYSPGEDLRRLDWKVFARTGKSYVRVYQDETNLLCTLAIDISRSMCFGARSTQDTSGSKLEYAQLLSTGLSHIIACGQDQVGLGLLDDDLREFLPCAGTPTHLRHLQSRIEAIQPQQSTTLSAGLRALFERTPARGVLILFSDFLVDDLEDLFAALRLFRHRQFEVILLHLVHPQEEQLPAGASYRFEGLEGEGTLDCSPDDIRDEYARQFSQHLNTVRTYGLATGCDYRLISTAQPYLGVLGTFLVDRAG